MISNVCIITTETELCLKEPYSREVKNEGDDGTMTHLEIVTNGLSTVVDVYQV